MPLGSGNYQPGVADDPRRQEAITALQLLGGASRSTQQRDVIKNMIVRRLKELRDRQAAGNGGPDEKRFLEQWENGGRAPRDR